MSDALTLSRTTLAKTAALKSVLLVLAALAVASVMGLGRPAAAYPSASPNAVWPTAKVDAQLKPRFGDLVGLHRHWGEYRRPSWSRWRRFYWGGECGRQGYGQTDGYAPTDGYGPAGGGCGAPSYCDPSDPYCGQGVQPGCDPSDPYCGQGGWYTSNDPYYLPPTTVWGSGLEHVTVDCARDQPGRLNEALNQLADGGTLHLKGRGPACTQTLQISRPVIIAGEPPAAFPIDGDAGPGVLTAPPGSPCAVIDAGPRAGVEFRDVIIEAPSGGRSACIQAFSSAVALVRTTLNYTGESSAIYLQGGKLIGTDADINSSGYDAAIWTEDATIGFRDVGVVTASTGFDVRPGVGQKISLDRVSVTSAPGGPNGGGPVSAIIGRRGRAGDCAFVISNTFIGGFRTGMIFEAGLKVDASHVRIAQSRMGIAIDGAALHMDGSHIDATEYGVYAYSGRAEINGGYVTSVLREPFGADPGAFIAAHDVYLYSDDCRRFGRRDLGWSCRLRREAPAWLYRYEPGSSRHWGWSGY